MGQANICEDALTDLIINWQRDQERGHVEKEMLNLLKEIAEKLESC